MIPFPLIIENEPELRRFIRDIFKEVTKDPYSDLPLYMKKQDCYNYQKIGRRIVDAAITSGDLVVSLIHGKKRIKRDNFLKWINKTK
ncbi:MAG: hypothetical protein M1445_16370 [Bacteroidetes bacterium]|nr:hypothetical protein [Bacteroidota bacterium]